MLNIYEAKTFDGCTNLLLDKLKENLKNGGKHIVLVPEKFTLSGEKIIFDKLNTDGIDNLEVTSFSRLAEKNVDITKKCLTSAGSLMLFTKAVLNASDKLQKYKNCKSLNGFYKEMYSVISMLRNSGVKSSELKNLNLPKNTSYKLQDIAVLYDSYLKMLEDNYYDATSLYEEFATSIEENNLFSDCYFYILDYYFFSTVQINIIEKLLVYSKGVNISLPLNNTKNERIYPFNTLKILQNVAQKVGTNCVVKRGETMLLREFNHIVDNMFSYEKCDKFDTDKIEIYSNDNIEKEVEFACIKIKKEVLLSNCRYRDFAVVLGDLNEYAPIVKKVFYRYDIPFFIDKKEPMLAGAGTRFLLDSIKAVVNKFDKEYMLKVAVNPYANISKEQFYDFSNYVEKYGINYSRFLEKFTIGTNDKFYNNAELVRSKLVSMLNFTECKTNKEYVYQCKNYLLSCDFVNSTNNFMDSQVEYKNEFYLNITNQMYDKIYAVLDEYLDILGEEESTLEQFLITLENMYSDIEIGQVPVFADSVYIGEARESMYDRVENMIVLGANQGVIPAFFKEAMILNNTDLDLLQKNDLIINPTPKSNNNDALFYTVQLLAIAKNKLIVSFNEEKGSKSDIIRELQNLFNIGIKSFTTDISKIYLEGGEERLIEELPSIVATRENMQNILIKDLSLQKIPEVKKPYNAMFSLLDNKEQIVRYISTKERVYKINNGNKLFFTKNRTYISQLEGFFNCPYKHFMDYGLGLKDKETVDVSAMDVGVFIHDVLEKFFRRTTNFDLSKAEIENKVEGILQEVLSSDKNQALFLNKPLTEKIKKECIVTCVELVDRLQYTKFVPYKFEVAFGYDGTDKIELEVGDKVISLIGKIDRVDKYKNRIMVIDYKTGGISSDFADIYTGKKIQLYMYLSALLLKDKELKPAGVYYQPISINYNTDDGNRYQYKGQSNSDEEVLKMLDRSIFDDSNGGKSILISGMRLTKSGDFYESAKKNVLSDKEFDLVCKYVSELSKKACTEIMDGCFIPSPNGSGRNSSCRYCQYKNVCGFDKNTGRSVDKITKQTILEAVEND